MYSRNKDALDLLIQKIEGVINSLFACSGNCGTIETGRSHYTEFSSSTPLALSRSVSGRFHLTAGKVS